MHLNHLNQTEVYTRLKIIIRSKATCITSHISFFLCITLHFKRGSKKSENLNKSFVLNAFYRTSIVGSVPDLDFRHEWH